MAFTGIMGRVRAPMFLAQRTAFLEFHLLGDLVVAGISTLVLTFLALSNGFLLELTKIFQCFQDQPGAS